MKMVMTVTVTESGCLYYNKRPGAILDSGAIIAHLDLDDASRIQRVQMFTGRFRESEPGSTLPVWGDKLNQIYQSCRSVMDNIFAGYCLPDPFFQPKIKETIEKMMTVLKDPSLPLLELQDVISSISGRIPASVEKKIRKLMALYASNITSVLAQFPSQQVASVIDTHAATLQKRADRDVFFLTTQGIVQLVQRYRNGIRGNPFYFSMLVIFELFLTFLIFFPQVE
jgi:acetyl-CoA carboxylase/biotin carboxylase 1